MLNAEFITAIVGLSEFEIVDGWIEEDGAVILRVKQKWGVAICPNCLEPSGSVLEYVERYTRDLSISGRVVYLNFHHRRYRCRNGCPSFWERFKSIESPAAHYTRKI
jgi:transposase